MFRTLLMSTRRLLVPRPANGLSLMMEEPTTTIYDVRRNESHARHVLLRGRPTLFKYEDFFIEGKHVPWAFSGQKSIHIPNPTIIFCNFTSMIKCVDLNDLKDVPPAAFWPGIALGSSQLVIPLLELLAGYSSVFTMYQLYSAALSVAFIGGVKMGIILCDKCPSWDTMKFSVVPASIALIGLLLPYPLGFLVVSGSVLTALYLDLKACIFPPWASSLLMFIYLTTAIGLLLALAAYVLFHNKKNRKKRKDDDCNDKKDVKIRILDDQPPKQ